VSLAGPASNFVLAVVSAFAARAVFDATSVPPVFGFSDLPLAVEILFSFAMVNLFLGVFNLLPIPPLDGAALIERVLPTDWLPAWYRFRPYGFLVLFLLVFATGFVNRVLEPFLDELVDFVFST
jgi:Zn-dependent protease